MESERAEFQRLMSFVQGESVGAGTVLASICCSIYIVTNELHSLTVSLTRIPTRELQVSDGRTDYTFRVEDTALQVFRMVAACPTLTDLNLRFSFSPKSMPASRRPDCAVNSQLVLHAFSVVRTCRSLSKLAITFSADGSWMTPPQALAWDRYLITVESCGGRFFLVDLPTLLRDDPFFEKLTLTALLQQSRSGIVDWEQSTFGSVPWTGNNPDSRPDSLFEKIQRGYSGKYFISDTDPQGNYALIKGYCFSRNPASKLWTLTTSRPCKDWDHPCERFPLQDFVTLFPTVQQGARVSNVVLKVLVLTSTLSNRVCEVPQKAVADLVANNITFEKMEGGGYPLPLDGKDFQAMALALVCNRSLKEFGPYRCTFAEFQEIVRVLEPGASGRQANTSSCLSTLKLCLSNATQVLDCMTALESLLGSNTALKHLELSCQESQWRFTLFAGSDSQVPDAAGGKANTSLSTLKLRLSNYYLIKNMVLVCMTVLKKFLGLVTTLRHVELPCDWWHESWRSIWVFPWNPSYTRDERDFQSEIRVGLEMMLENDLRRNTCLQSLSVGWWRLLRVGTGDQWEMMYNGPCLRLPDVQREEYVVKVKLR